MGVGRTSSRSRIDPPPCDYAAGLGCLSGSPYRWDLPAPRGSGRLGRFIGAGSLCDHRSDRIWEPLRPSRLPLKGWTLSMAGPSRPPNLANVRLRLIPKPRVAVPKLKLLLVLLRIVLFQPEQLVNRVHGPL